MTATATKKKTAKKTSSKKAQKAAATKDVAGTIAPAAGTPVAGTPAPAEPGLEPLAWAEGFETYDFIIDEITPNGGRVCPPEYIDGLAKSIRENGLIAPIVVGSDQVVIAGDQRLAAFKLLGRKTIPGRYATDPKSGNQLASTEARALAQTWVENMQRRNPSPIETGKFMAKALKDGIAADAKALAKMLGVSTSHVSKYLSLAADGIQALQDALAEHTITAEAAHAIIARGKTDEGQLELLTQLLTATEGRKITVEDVDAATPEAGNNEEGGSGKPGRPRGRATSNVALSAAAMPETGNISGRLSRSAEGGWSVQITVTIPHKKKTFVGFDAKAALQAEIVKINNGMIEKELEVARDRLGG